MVNPKRVFYTPQGEVVRELTDEEVDALAAQGDTECKRIKGKDAFSKAGNLQAKIDAIAAYLGLA